MPGALGERLFRRGAGQPRPPARGRSRGLFGLASALAGALGLTSGACSVLFDSSEVQCARDGDCAARGAAFSGKVCSLEGLCVAPGPVEPGPVEPGPVEPGPDAVVEISSGDFHTCARRASGKVLCWGKNEDAQVGDGQDPSTRQIVAEPVLVANVTDAVQLSAGEEHSCILRKGGSVVCWGGNDVGQLGDGTRQPRLGAVQVVGVSGAVQAAAGDSFSCALLATGRVVCWGLNRLGQLGDGRDAATEPTSLRPVEVAGLDDAVALSLGDSHACAVRRGGSVVCWGANGFDQLGTGDESGGAPQSSNLPVSVAEISTARSVESGKRHSCALLSSNALRCWGSNARGELGDEQASGERSAAPVAVVGLDEPRGVSAGRTHSCAYLENGTVRCWGSNDFAELGRNPATFSGSDAPIEVVGLGSATQISVGNEHSCVLLSTGEVYCWGHNNLGQLGDGLTEQLSVKPLKVEGLDL